MAQIAFLEGGGRIEVTPNSPGINVVNPINFQVITRYNALGEQMAFGMGEDGDPAYTQQENHTNGVIVLNDQGGNSINVEDGDISPTIRAETHGNLPVVCVGAFALSSKQQSLVVSVEVANTLGGSDYKEPQCVTYTQSSFGGYSKGVGTIKASGGNLGGGSETLVVAAVRGFAVRRLMPIECERLQGFPDGWTIRKHDGTEVSDTQRYRALGNSVAVPCVEFVLSGIANGRVKA